MFTGWFALEVPDPQTMARQEQGVRAARALPYALEATGEGVGNFFRVDFNNDGRQAAVFHARSANPADLPQCFTVEPHQSSTGLWEVAGNRTYDLSVHGPNGFLRSFKGRQSDSSAKLRVSCHGDDDRWELQVTNRSGRRVTVRVFDRYSGRTSDQRLDSGETMSRSWHLRPFGGWYEHVVTVLEDDAFEYRLAGHLEPGRTASAIR